MNCQVDYVFREQIKEHKILDRSNSKSQDCSFDSGESGHWSPKRKSKISPPISPISKKSEIKILVPICEIESENEHSNREVEVYKLK